MTLRYPPVDSIAAVRETRISDSFAQREKLLVGGQGQKFFELVGNREPLEQRARVAEASRIGALLARHPDQHGGFLSDERFGPRLGYEVAPLEARAVSEPLPHLGPRDLG